MMHLITHSGAASACSTEEVGVSENSCPLAAEAQKCIANESSRQLRASYRPPYFFMSCSAFSRLLRTLQAGCGLFRRACYLQTHICHACTSIGGGGYSLALSASPQPPWLVVGRQVDIHRPNRSQLCEPKVAYFLLGIRLHSFLRGEERTGDEKNCISQGRA